MTFPEHLAHLRKETGLKQREVAAAVGISWRGYQNYELGLREPSLSTLVALADFTASAWMPRSATRLSPGPDRPKRSQGKSLPPGEGGWPQARRMRPGNRLASPAAPARSEAERAEIGVGANPTTTPIIRRTVYAAPGFFDRRGKAQGRRGHRRPPYRFARPPSHEEAARTGRLFVKTPFLLDRARPRFLFGKTKRKWGVHSPGNSRSPYRLRYS